MIVFITHFISQPSFSIIRQYLAIGSHAGSSTAFDKTIYCFILLQLNLELCDKLLKLTLGMHVPTTGDAAFGATLN